MRQYTECGALGVDVEGDSEGGARELWRAAYSGTLYFVYEFERKNTFDETERERLAGFVVNEACQGIRRRRI